MVLSLEMGWRHLLFENWPVDPDLVDAHLPEAFEPDTHGGTAWLSVVPFTNVNVRPKGLPEWASVPLPELNLRTYITRDGVPGVYFFSLDAQGITSVLGARLFQRLPYYYARIDLECNDGAVDFRSRRLHPGDRPAVWEGRYRPTGEPFQSSQDSLAKFLVERYRFYTEAPDGTVRYTDVSHDAWTLYPAEADVEAATLCSANGFDRPAADPVYYYSPGLDVVASPSKRAEETP